MSERLRFLFLFEPTAKNETIDDMSQAIPCRFVSFLVLSEEEWHACRHKEEHSRIDGKDWGTALRLNDPRIRSTAAKIKDDLIFQG